MRRFRHFSADDSASEINISPLIDVVFILLIFFIVTTVFVEETGVDVNKPRAASAEDLEKNSILIAVTANGQVYQGGRSIGVNGVRSVVAAMLEDEKSLMQPNLRVRKRLILPLLNNSPVITRSL